jgi:DNA-binding transcriptional MerR regulator
MEYSLEETAARLGITPTTLHQWNAQFATLLSDFAYKELVLKGLAVQRRFTEADIALLQQAKILLQRGHTYDQVRRELTSQPASQPIDTGAPMLALEHREHMASTPAGLLTLAEHAGAGRDATIVTSSSVEQVPQGLIEQLGEALQRLWLKQEAVYGQVRLWRERLPRALSSWLGVGLVLCFIAILTGLSVVVVFEQPSVDNSKQSYATLPAVSAAPTSNSALLPGAQSTPVPVRLTPSAVPAASPSATVALPLTTPPTLVAPPSMTAALPVPTPAALPLPRSATIGTQGGKTVRVRKAASLNATPLNFTLADGTHVIIIDGPVEADGYTWWNIEVDRRQGWCACTFVSPL